VTLTRSSIDTSYDEEASIRQSLLDKLRPLLVDIIEQADIGVHSVTGRIKTKDSLLDKIARKDKYSTLSQITDFIGMRVVAYFNDDLEKIAETITSNFKVDEENSIDKRQANDPERFGYMSLHYVAEINKSRCEMPEYSKYKGIKFEIQIRTVLQHGWAEIEHDLGYKVGQKIPEPIRRKFSQASSLLELTDRLFSEVRQDIASYAGQVDSTLPSSFDLRIDEITVEKYIKSKHYYEMFQEIIVSHIPRGEYDKFDASEIVERLLRVGFTTIGQVDEFIKENKKLLRYYIRFNYSGREKGINPVALLNFAAYTKGQQAGTPINKILGRPYHSSLVTLENSYKKASNLAKL
jgi:putative GTP pyrophosphokinase